MKKFIFLVTMFLFTLVCPVSSEWMEVEVTAYTPYECGGSYTANGEVPHEGGIACNFLPFGTKVQIDGVDYYVNDRAGYDHIIDIFMNDYDSAIAWGRRVKKVFIYR